MLAVVTGLVYLTLLHNQSADWLKYQVIPLSLCIVSMAFCVMAFFMVICSTETCFHRFCLSDEQKLLLQHNEMLMISIEEDSQQ